MQLYVMRHGQTNYNIQNLCNGDPSRDVRLTDLGIRQAEQVAEELKDIKLDLILVSELPRTSQTAQVVNRYHGAKMQIHPAINDIRSGFEDRPVAEYHAAIAADKLNCKCNDGESLLEYKQRVLQFLDWLREQPFGSVLVVAHEETLRVIAAYFQGLNDEDMIQLHFNNCEVLQYSLP